MYGEVPVDRLHLGGVVPVMEARSGQEPVQAAEVEAHVRVDERGLDAHERDVGEERRFREPER
jgi:hypothetical protein